VTFGEILKKCELVVGHKSCIIG